MDYFDEVSKQIESLKTYNSLISEIIEDIYKAYKLNSQVLVSGNGGSFADGVHFVGELICTFINRERDPIKALELSSNQAEVTAWSNDFSYSTFLERKIEAHGNKGDIAIFLTTSGGNIKQNLSTNLINACIKAKEKGILTISLLGKNGGDLKDISDKYILINSNKTSIIQECHMSILHKICYGIEEKLL